MTKRRVKNVLACTIGNTLEWFDYTLYGAFTTTLSELFFPFKDQSTSRIWVYLVFALGFFSRPIGGLLLGHIGDKFGRKKTLIVSILTMAIPTFLIGVLPTYDQIGILAPTMLAIIRFFQGVAIGGEFTGSMAYLAEQAPAKKRGLYGSWSDFGSPLGVLLGFLSVTTLLATLTDDQFKVFGWRIPFLLSLLFAIFGTYLRFGIDETKDLEKEPARNQHTPIIETIKYHRRTVFYGVSLAAYGGVTFYMLLTFLHNYLKVSGIATQQEAAIFTIIANIFITITIPIGGFLSDKFTRKRVMLYCIYAAIIVTPAMFYTLSFPGDLAMKYFHVFCEILLGITLGIFFGGRAAFYSEAFPTHLRCTALALAFGISHSCFAGTTPLISEILLKTTGTINSLSIMMFAFAISAIFSLYKLEDRTGKELL